MAARYRTSKQPQATTAFAMAVIALCSCIAAVSSKNLPEIDQLQGVWNGKRTSAAYISWDEDNAVFDGGCIRNDERLTHAAFDDDEGVDVSYSKGTVAYDAEMQLWSKYDGSTAIKQTYTTPTDYANSNDKFMVIAGIGPFLGGYEGRVRNFTRRAIVYNVGGKDNGTVGCLDWDLQIDKKEKKVKLIQVEAFRVSIFGDEVVMRSDLCSDGEFTEPQCVIDKRPKLEEDVKMDSSVNGTEVDAFTYCVWSDHVRDDEKEPCLKDTLFPALQSPIENMVSGGELNDDGDENDCLARYTARQEVDYDRCFGPIQKMARDMLDTERKAVNFCEAYVKCTSCQYCSKYGWNCVACNINATSLGAAVEPTGVGSVDFLSGVTKSDGVFQSSQLGTGDSMELEDWAALVDSMYALPNVETSKAQQGMHEIEDPLSQWPGFLDNINLDKDAKYKSIKDSFERLYGPRLTHTVGPYEQLVVSATVVTEWECSAGPCVDLVKDD